MSSQTKEKDIVKVTFKKPIYRKHSWIIPITQTGDHVFQTGQKLSYEKMTGKKELTDKEIEKYPHVINPHTYPKLAHGKKLDRNNPVSNALLKLAILSGKMAESISDYNESPMKYVGYIEDKVADSIVYNKDRDNKYEAETAVRNSPIEDYRRIALIINYKLKKTIQVENSPADYIKSELLKACEENPTDVLQCFPKYNDDIARDIYILELISYKILSKRPNGEIYDGDIFVGSNLSGAKNFMSIGANVAIQDKWKKKLDVKKGKASEKEIDKLESTHSDSRIDKYKEHVNSIKSYVFDENAQGAEYSYNVIEKEYNDLLDEKTRDLLLDKINTLKNVLHSKKIDKKITGFKSAFHDMDLEAVRKKITIKSSNYTEEDCKDFWDNREKLIEYMVKIKFDQ